MYTISNVKRLLPYVSQLEGYLYILKPRNANFRCIQLTLTMSGIMCDFHKV
mgnify:CR=1 FL=1